MSSMTQKIRDALAGGAMTITELAAKVGGEEKKVRDLCTFLCSRGELSSMGRAAARSVALKGDGSASPKPKKKAAKKRKAAKRAAVKRRSYREVADQVAARAATSDRSRERQHVATTFSALEAVIELDGAEAYVVAVFRSHKEAVELLTS